MPPVAETDSIRLWVDADACPGAIKDILFRAAERRRIDTTLVANHSMRIPKSRYLRLLQVGQGFDVADTRIVAELNPGDLVITADVPLAAEVVKAGATALNPRGTLYTRENVAEHLSRRDMMDELRSAGMVSGGPPALGKSEIQAFANALDRFLTQAARN